MDKRTVYHLWMKVRHIRPVYFLVIAVVCAALCVIGLRQNNLEMARLRDAVYAADRDNKNVVGALQNLQAYVTAHMNTDLSAGPNAPYPPIQLQYTYDRAVQAAGAAASATNAKIYTDAQHYCEQQDPYDFSGRNRVPCVQQYIQTHGATLPNIPDSLYEFAFASPSWSPDLAGWSMVAAIASFVAFVVSWIALKLLRLQSR